VPHKQRLRTQERLRTQGSADGIRENVMALHGIAEEECEKAASYCTAEVLVDAIRKEFPIPEFKECGLGFDGHGGSYVGSFFAGPAGSGWARLRFTRFRWLSLSQAVTGLERPM
jgi:hypothetical protein